MDAAAGRQAVAVDVLLRHAIMGHMLAKVCEGRSAVEDVPVGANHRNLWRRPRHTVALGRGRRFFAAGLRCAVVKFGGVNAALV